MNEIERLLDHRIIALEGKRDGWDEQVAVSPGPRGQNPYTVAVNELLALRETLSAGNARWSHHVPVA